MRLGLAIWAALLGFAPGARAAEHVHDADAGGTSEGRTMPMHGHMAEDPLRALAIADRLEWRSDGSEDAAAWDVLGWIGKDENRLWLRSEGERSGGVTEEGNVEALWGRPLARWWDVLAGLRHDVDPGSARTWAAVGVTGLAPYGFATQITAYVDRHGATLLQAEFEYDLLLTQRLILQPRVEAKLFGKDDEARGVVAGLSQTAAGIRLRYQIVREFAPYAGVEWTRGGNGGDSRLSFVAGLRAWL